MKLLEKNTKDCTSKLPDNLVKKNKQKLIFTSLSILKITKRPINKSVKLKLKILHYSNKLCSYILNKDIKMEGQIVNNNL